MAFEIYDNRGSRSGEKFIAVDNQARLYLSSGLQDELGCRGREIELYVAYDKVNKRIAIAKPDVVRLTGVNPMRFDANRSYASARGFLHHNQIPARAARYYYDGNEKSGEFRGWLTFKLDEYDAPDARLPE